MPARVTRRKNKPYGRTKGRRRTKRVPRRLYRRKARMPNLGKLIDSKVNTVWEKKMVDITRKELEGNQVNKVLRLEHGIYDAGKLEWALGTDDQVPEAYTEIYSAGKCIELVALPVEDSKVVTKPTGMQDQDLTLSDEKEQFGGDNIGLLEQGGHGYRANDTVKLRSFFIRLRTFLAESGASTSNIRNVSVHYAIIQVKAKWYDENRTPKILPDPTCPALLISQPWNYNSALDLAERPSVIRPDGYNFKTLAKGHVNMQVDDRFCQDREATISYKFPKPINHEYHTYAGVEEDSDIRAAQVQGRLPVAYKYFFVCRSNIHKESTYQSVGIIPHMWVNTQTNYYD